MVARLESPVNTNLYRTMQIQPQEIEYKERIGHTEDGNPIMELGLKGGLHIVCSVRGPKIDYLGVGPHRAVARYLAKKRMPSITLTQLAKSDWVDPASFSATMLEKYESITVTFNKARK
jgi:hypothetical protein